MRIRYPVQPPGAVMLGVEVFVLFDRGEDGGRRGLYQAGRFLFPWFPSRIDESFLATKSQLCYDN
jgi:hypothetical protein